MKAFILAAGEGTRLRPLTNSIPKCLVPVRGTPLLGIWMDLCHAHGIDDVLINCSSHAKQVREFVEQRGHGSLPRVTITEEEPLLGSAGTLRANKEWALTESFFWILYGDVLTNANLSQMLQFHRSDLLGSIGVIPVSKPQQCGIVTTDEENVVREFVEKPARPASNLAFSGIMIANRQLLDSLPEFTPADIGFHVMPKLVGKITAYQVQEYLLDIGTPATYEQAQISWPGLEIAAAS